MNAILAIPEEVRLIVLALLGAAIGTQVNRGIYTLAYGPRSFSPWSRPLRNAPPRHWYDRIPVFGWLTVSREDALHGSGYWIRPLCLELCCAVGAPALYIWETGNGLIPLVHGVTASPELLHSVFLAHLVLIPLMLVATFIDIDEQMIPDSTTIPGTIIALILACCLPLAALPIVTQSLTGVLQLQPLRLVPPPHGHLGLGPFPLATWPAWLNHGAGLLLGLACWWGWYVVVVPKTLWLRSGWSKALGFMFESMRRHRDSRWMTAAVVLGTPVIVGIWWASGERWASLLSALVGMAFGGGLIWAVRIIGSAMLKKEAMGFGDVTLMAMIGAFLGWQACLIAFFLAPFAGLAIALPRRVLTEKQDIAFGPFLCLGTLATVLGWAFIWERWGRLAFGMGWVIPGLLAAGLLCIAVLLGAWQAIRRDKS